VGGSGFGSGSATLHKGLGINLAEHWVVFHQINDAEKGFGARSVDVVTPRPKKQTNSSPGCAGGYRLRYPLVELAHNVDLQ
jgi:hypothetical protein